MTWRPLQPNHAIERVRLIAQFSDVLPPKFIRKLAADGEERRIGLGFTSKNIREGNELKVGPLSVQVGNRRADVVGWDWQRVSAANLPLETLAVEAQILVYETSQYSRWSALLSRFEDVTLPTLHDALGVVDLASLSLEYVDRFIFDGEPSEARPDAVFQGVADNLHVDAQSGRELWHYHRGWFEEASGVRLLVNQNIDAQDGKRPDGSAIRSVQVFTKTELRPSGGGFDYETLKPQIETMHDRSIELFCSVLRQEVRSQVGIQGENNA